MDKFPCWFCDEKLTIAQLMDHQVKCTKDKFEQVNFHDCFTCKKKVKDLLNHKCDYEVLKNEPKICFLCNTVVDDNYYEHSVICFHQYKDQQNQDMEQIIQDGKANLNYLNLSFNCNMNSVKNLQEIIARKIADYKDILHKQREDDQEIKNLNQENVKLVQTIEIINEEMLELKKLTYDNMTMLTNQEDIQNLNQEIIKLNQIVEENSTEFLAIKKLTQHPKIMQHLFKDKHIIKHDQMNLRLLSEEAYYSQAVYSPKGYYYRIKIYIRSTNVNNVAIYFQLIRSELDDALKWPFAKKIIFTLRNNDKLFAHTITPENYIKSLNASSFDKPTEEYNVAVGFPNFILHKELKQFIINKILFITITIQ
ncbi:TNF receptor-associated factor 5-like [Hydra vulgaris]|uniref:TNF receptor-associated factor 5-like n=1 Tax=Hydra vulgaris TaxID=6087 RepID=A0ABM4CBB5_HYDVU